MLGRWGEEYKNFCQSKPIVKGKNCIFSFSLSLLPFLYGNNTPYHLIKVTERVWERVGFITQQPSHVNIIDLFSQIKVRHICIDNWKEWMKKKSYSTFLKNDRADGLADVGSWKETKPFTDRCEKKLMLKLIKLLLWKRNQAPSSADHNTAQECST